VSIALMSAAVARSNPEWRRQALELARSCAVRSVERAAVGDAAICHGAMGVVHILNRFYQYTGDEVFEVGSRVWLDRGLQMRTEHPLAGFPAKQLDNHGRPIWVADPGLVTGAIGVALVLLATISELEPLWDRLLLTDL